jgi:hypothetical protein
MWYVYSSQFECHIRGWANEANRLDREGHYEAQRPWQRELKAKMLECIGRAEKGDEVDIAAIVRDFRPAS